jgi:hypothetical protein
MIFALVYREVCFGFVRSNVWPGHLVQHHLNERRSMDAQQPNRRSCDPDSFVWAV